MDISFQDKRADIILGIAWAGAFYGMAMIACTFSLIDRWRGPNGKRRTGFCSAVGAIILSIFWPVVFIFLCGTKR